MSLSAVLCYLIGGIATAKLGSDWREVIHIVSTEPDQLEAGCREAMEKEIHEMKATMAVLCVSTVRGSSNSLSL